MTIQNALLSLLLILLTGVSTIGLVAVPFIFISEMIKESGKISIVKQGDYFLIEKHYAFSFFDKRYLGGDYWWLMGGSYIERFTTIELAEKYYQEYLKAEEIKSNITLIKKLK